MKILIFPKGENPYQELLYKELRLKYPNDSFTYVDAIRKNFFIYPLIFLYNRLRGYRIIHIHWLVFSLGLRVPFAKTISYVNTLICLYSLKLLGYKIVWTVHDIKPHERETLNDDSISICLSKLAAAKIAHSDFTLSQMKEAGFNMNKTAIIPHGNYNNVYPSNISQEEAREKLGIKSDEFVILFFGAIRPYKGVDDLVNTFVNMKETNTRLVIAGKCIDKQLSQEILSVKQGSSIDFYDSYVKDEDVAMYFKASDIVCLPFKAITTSGSVLLALTFGKPIIAPRTGSLVDLPDNVGYFYDLEQKNGLEIELLKSIKVGHKLEQKSAAAIDYSSTLDWQDIAEKTYRIYEQVLFII